MASRSSKTTNGDSMLGDIVITGLSGRFPESNNVEEFKQQLLNGIDMVTNDPRRWPSGMYGLPERFGKLKNLSHFDAQFFGVHAKQAEQMDPQLRILLEVTQEAILDSGYNPQELRGSKCGVFIGACASESLEFWERKPEEMNGYGLTGCSRSMFANRITFAFDFKGPSFSLDTACSSSLYALSQAIRSIQAGDCDSAIVGGSNLLLKPNACVHFQSLGMLSPEGCCKSFDSTGNGYVRSEAVSVIFLQKAQKARRVYASVLGVKTNSDGYKDLGITYPSGQMHLKLIQEAYEETGINPEEVCYIESHGTGTRAGDPEELYAVSEFFCKERKEPLLVGSVKSNMGHSEGASALCSIAKVIVAMESGFIPANLHYNNPNPDIPSLLDGRVKVITKNHPWNGGIVAVNSFGFGGANAHVILHSNPKLKAETTPKPLPFPRVIGVSGRTEEAVQELLDASRKNKDDEEFLSLLDKIHNLPLAGHNFRGYALLDDSNSTGVSSVPSEKRPIWYVYPGMGSQWPAMGKDFMKIEAFRKSIEKIGVVLTPYGIDIVNLIMKGSEEAFENIVNAYVAITAMQIALTDMLKILKIEPDGIIGHSFGEVGCAYADGCLTAEQAVLCTLERGLAVTKSNSPPGTMASVGLSWKEAKERCPPLVYPACHNADSNVTISGDHKEMKSFMATLASEDVFVREVKSAGYAFHCRHITKAAPILLNSLGNVIPNPKSRSSRWVSTSVPESSWDKPESKLCSPQYYVNNLLSPVLFHEGVKHIPKNALLIEIAPTGLFKGLLKKTIGPECATVSLAKSGHNDNVSFFMLAVGKIYASGAQPCMAALYGTPSFPVGRGTPMISPHVKWNHGIEWAVASFVGEEQNSGEFEIEIDLTKEENQFLLGHKIDGRVLYPGAGYLILLWQTLARLKNLEFEKMSVILEEIQLHRATILSKDETIKFHINIFKSSGAFELREGSSLVVSGEIRVPEDITKEVVDLSNFKLPINTKDLPLSGEDVYKELRLRGYEYSEGFKGIVECDNERNKGRIYWKENWICFLDIILQFTVINNDTKDLLLPTKLQKVIIDPIAHQEVLQSSKTGELNVECYKDIGVIRCAGIEVRGCKAAIAPKKPNNRRPKLEKYQFIPYLPSSQYLNEAKLKKTEILTVFSQIVLENTGKTKIKMNEVILETQIDSCLSPILKNIFESEPLLSVELAVVIPNPMDTTFFDEKKIKTTTSLQEKLNLVVCNGLLSRQDVPTLKILCNSVTKGGFILLEESEDIQNSSVLTSMGLELISKQYVSDTYYLLLRKLVKDYSKPVMIQISCYNFSWVESLKNAIKENEEEDTKIYVYSNERINGVVGMINALRKESDCQNLRSILIQDKTSESFSLNNYSEHLKKDLVHNVLKDGVWGSYRHLLLDDVEDTKEKMMPHAIINTLVRGDLSSLRWIESSLSKSKSSGEELCHVYYASLNFRDIMLATGKLPPDALPGNLAGQDNILGLEFAGRNSNGERLMGLVESRSLATTVLIDPMFCWKVPKNWSMEEAATIPVVYCTAYYSLIMRGGLQPGESVLIHAGSGGVGIASISIALHMKCKVFTTVGSQSKRDFLKRTFPQLTDKNIGYSRDTAFEQFILSETHGRGVDIVLNSLASEQLYASVRCLANNGRFLEIGKVDLSNNSPLGMNVFLKNVSFHGILVDALFLPGMDKAKMALVKLIDEGIKNGAVKPLPATVFSEEQAEEAFRYMATGKHIGKVVIKIRDEEPQHFLPPKPKFVPAIPRAYMHPHKSYILVGGLGGFGLELTNWLVNRGATQILLSSRSGMRTGYQSLCIRKWKQKGVKVIISTEDVTIDSGARRLIEQAKCLGPVGGIFNLAAVLKDRMIENQNEESFKICCSPKVAATIHLDKVSREITKDLDHFVTFSSVASGRGNPGQSNYAFANSVMERICEDRRQDGYPGLAIQWGAVGDVGLAVQLLGSNEVEIAGTLPQRISSCLSTLDIFLEQDSPIVSSFVLADRQGSSNSDKKVMLIDTISNILGMKDKNNWPRNTTLAELGMDSLMSAEIKHTLERNFDIVLNSSEIRGLTFDKLSEYESRAQSSNDSSDKPNMNKEMEEKKIEVMPKQTMVVMSKESPTNNKAPIFFIHPIEGTIDALVDLARKITAPVYGLQCTKDAPVDCIENLAGFYIKHIKTVRPSGPYNIVGYSFGSCVAFEMGIQLERVGQKVKLWLIDGSPTFVSLHLLNERALKSVKANTDEEQSETLVYFMRQFKQVNRQKIVADLMRLPSWEQKLSSSMKMLAQMTSISESDLTSAASSLFNKLQAADKYKPSGKFRGEVYLLKATDSNLKLSEDYGLAELCQEKVKIENIEGNHASILMGSSAKRLAKILEPIG